MYWLFNCDCFTTEGRIRKIRTRQRKKKTITSQGLPNWRWFLLRKKKKPTPTPKWLNHVPLKILFFKNFYWSMVDLQCCESSRCTAYRVFWFQQKTKPLMTEFSVKSTIISRYAFTTVACRLLNRASEDQEITFQMQIPAAAFITNFTM